MNLLPLRWPDKVALQFVSHFVVKALSEAVVFFFGKIELMESVFLKCHVRK